MRKIILFAFIFSSLIIKAQVGIGTVDIHDSAILEIVSNDSGVLFPKVFLESKDDVSTVLNPANGLLVYNMQTMGEGNMSVIKNCLYIFNGDTQLWEGLNNMPTHYVGDLKHSLVVADHDGWINLDGRSLAGLSPSQVVAANSLGFTTNLPDLTDKLIKKKGALTSTGGTNNASFTITQSNLPNVNFTGNTNTVTDHNHSIDGMEIENLDVVTGLLSGLGLTFTNFSFFGYNPGASTNTEDSGSHDHTVTVNSGGSNQAVSISTENEYFSANTFVYLGE
jgi:hypothetical protein